jgi:hypothetical protein
MLTNFFTIFSKINNITSKTNKILNVNTTFSSCPFFKKHLDNYIALSNQKSFEIYNKYNTNTFSKFSVLNLNTTNNINTTKNINIKKYINSGYFFIVCYYIFLASFSKNSLLIV